MPVQNTCAVMSPTADKIVPTSAYMVNARAQMAPGAEQIGTIHAVSVETGRTLWKSDQRAGAMSLVTTGGGLVFGGDTNGQFRALDQNTGKVLWEVNLGAAVTGYPITYSANGKQYVAVSTGASLVSSGVNRLAPEIKATSKTEIYVFALPGNQPATGAGPSRTPPAGTAGR
jgi:outer membrane protein assembly factor BamB